MIDANDCTTALGMDLGIKTGSLVQVMVEPDTDLLRDYRVLASWNKGPKIKDELSDIARWFEQNVLWYLTVDHVGINQTMGIDWNRLEIYWSANKQHSNTKTYVAGYVACHCRENHIRSIFVSPDDLREFFTGKRSKIDKNLIQRHFLSLPKRLTPEKMMGLDDLTDHDIDAMVLAYQVDLMSRHRSCPEHLMV